MGQLSILAIGAVISVGMLVIFMVLQAQNGSILDLSMKWLWVSLVPVGIALFVGNFISSIKTPLLSVSGTANKLPTIGESEAIIVSGKHSDNSVWTDFRASTYSEANGLVLTHEYRPSKEKGQEFDIFIYLIRHTKNSTKPPSQGFDDVDRVEFYFGDAWDNQIFTVKNDGGTLGVRTHAYGTFLAICRIHFKDGRKPALVYRYIDFEMADNA